jgi:lysophospholipase L1-like esterase
VGDAEFEPAQTIQSRIFLSAIMVDAASDARAIVTFGDSITDGTSSRPDANHRWPDFLAERLNAAGARVAVLNQGISGHDPAMTLSSRSLRECPKGRLGPR